MFSVHSPMFPRAVQSRVRSRCRHVQGHVPICSEGRIPRPDSHVFPPLRSRTECSEYSVIPHSASFPSLTLLPVSRTDRQASTTMAIAFPRPFTRGPSASRSRMDGTQAYTNYEMTSSDSAGVSSRLFLANNAWMFLSCGHGSISIHSGAVDFGILGPGLISRRGGWSGPCLSEASH